MADKKSLNKLYILFCFFITVFDKQANIHGSTNSISRLISLQNLNSTDQAVAMNRYKSSFIKQDNFYSGKHQAAVTTDQKIYPFLIYNVMYDFLLSKYFQSSCITFGFFNNSTFFGTTEDKWKVTISFDITKDINFHHQFWQPHLLQ